MMETAVVVHKNGGVIHWHLPKNRTAGALPDSRELWDVLWARRELVLGIAHTHPWNGDPYPSQTDLTTFAAVEAGLGRRLKWWVVTMDQVGRLEWSDGTESYLLAIDGAEDDAPWVARLRELSSSSSRKGEQHG